MGTKVMTVFIHTCRHVQICVLGRIDYQTREARQGNCVTQFCMYYSILLLYEESPLLLRRITREQNAQLNTEAISILLISPITLLSSAVRLHHSSSTLPSQIKQQKPTRNTKNFKKLKVQNKKKEIRKEKKNSKGMQIRSKRQVVKVD